MHLSSLFFYLSCLYPTHLRHLTLSGCNSWNAGRKKMPSSLAAKGKDHPAAWWIWTVNKDSSPVGLATTWVYRTLPQLSPMARFVLLYLWLSKLAISGHNEVSFSYGLQVSALNMFNTRNPAISIVRILHCVIVFYKVACLYEDDKAHYC